MKPRAVFGSGKGGWEDQVRGKRIKLLLKPPTTGEGRGGLSFKYYFSEGKGGDGPNRDWKSGEVSSKIQHKKDFAWSTKTLTYFSESSYGGKGLLRWRDWVLPPYLESLKSASAKDKRKR